jgi:hypothetical protein
MKIYEKIYEKLFELRSRRREGAISDMCNSSRMHRALHIRAKLRTLGLRGYECYAYKWCNECNKLHELYELSIFLPNLIT